jgi:hypothetical protein
MVTNWCDPKQVTDRDLEVLCNGGLTPWEAETRSQERKALFFGMPREVLEAGTEAGLLQREILRFVQAKRQVLGDKDRMVRTRKGKPVTRK